MKFKPFVANAEEWDGKTFVAEDDVVYKIFEKNYAVNARGEIFSFKTRKFLLGSINKDGYVVYKINGVLMLAHRVVVEAFNGRIGKNLIVHHRDGVRTNNDFCNLEVLNRADHYREESNVHNAYEKTRSVATITRAKPISKYSETGSFIKPYKSINEALREMSKTLKSKNSLITALQDPSTKSAGGYRWQILDPDAYVKAKDEIEYDMERIPKRIIVEKINRYGRKRVKGIAFNLEGDVVKEMIFQSIRSAACYVGLSKSAVSENLKKDSARSTSPNDGLLWNFQAI